MRYVRTETPVPFDHLASGETFRELDWKPGEIGMKLCAKDKPITRVDSVGAPQLCSFVWLTNTHDGILAGELDAIQAGTAVIRVPLHLTDGE